MDNKFENEPFGNENPEEGFDIENITEDLVESDGEVSIKEEADFSEIEEPEEPEELESEPENFSEEQENPIGFGIELESEEEEEEEEEEEKFKKFDNELKRDYISQQHPELVSHNNQEIKLLCKVTRNKEGVIIDENHRSIPILTKYEEAKILGARAKQINESDHVYVDVPPNIIDGYTIAQMELKEKKIPFIIRRPFPNGRFEYWRISDLEQVNY